VISRKIQIEFERLPFFQKAYEKGKVAITREGKAHISAIDVTFGPPMQVEVTMNRRFLTETPSARTQSDS